MDPGIQQKSGGSKFLVIAFVLVILGVGGYYFGVKNKTNKQVVVSEPTGTTNQKIYVSPKLGISFMYPLVSGGQDIEVKEEGNKIYIYYKKDNMQPSNGQFVEVFSKDISDSLEQAIQKRFLTNISPTDCYVEDVKPVIPADGSGGSFPESYQFKTIGFPIVENGTDPWFLKSSKCPSGYAKTNGIRYFLGDTQHPKTFVFFSIGQYAIMDEATKTPWQNTIKFLD